MHSFDVIIETEGLILRPFTIEDVYAHYKINLDPMVSKYTKDRGVKSLEEIQKRLR